ncbi:MAG: 2-phosphosulfolactate phosphatase [Chloroflexota bacterium]|nr:2-phosphosulfolactate phosphatase [Chloroflexota bacterium]
MVRPLTLDAAFLPVEVGRRPQSIAIAIDVLRASSSIITLFDRGCRSIGLAESTEAARAFARTSAPAQVLLCGEVGGLPPYGFDYGNSPSEFSRLDFTGKHVVMSTSNGTNAIRACAECAVTLVGALLNANAAVREALELRDGMREIVLVCAGRAGRFVLDDAVAAGYFSHVLLNEAKIRELPVVQTNAAVAAYRLYHSYPHVSAAWNESDSARNLQSIGLEQDISFCTKASMTRQVPRLEREVPASWEERKGLYVL